MNKNLQENFENYLNYLDDYARITVDLQKAVVDGYELGEITKEEVVDFCMEMEKIINTARVKEVDERFDEIFSGELNKRMREEMYVEEG